MRIRTIFNFKSGKPYGIRSDFSRQNNDAGCILRAIVGRRQHTIMKLTIEIERLLIIRGGSAYRCAKCEACGELVQLITVDEAAKLAHVGSRAIYKMVEAEKIHFIETSEELLLICFNSLQRGLSQADVPIISANRRQS